ncbi:MAG: penicillin-binding protein activator LpoB [Planctomycetota bacterium]|jgi:uncharacterized protein (TIGR02722 family)|nr:penicillin-binding protein activator LpoB [Planctomycetota bacterium]
MRHLISIIATVLILALAGCGGQTIDRVDPNTTIDLVPEWNDVDSRQVAEEMIADSLTRPWANEFMAKHDKKPIVRLAPDEVRVRTNGDVINKDIFLNDIRRAFINSGKVTVVSSRDESSATRAELAEQQEYATDETKHQQRQEFGADYILHGTINVQDQEEGRRSIKFYSVDLWLTDVQTRVQVWAGNKKIKKDVTRASNR